MRPFTWTKVAGVLAVLGFAGTAGAAERFNESGSFALGAERLFGVSWDKQSADRNGVSASVSVTSVSVLGKQLSSDPFAGPRIAFDYFVTDGISLGGSVGYSSISTSNDVSSSTAGVSLSGLDNTLRGWIVSPRVGYGYAFNDNVGIWPRLGFTYVGLSGSSGSTDLKQHFFALSAEVPLVFTPAPHTMLTIAPTVDWGFSGSTGTSGNSVDMTAIALGLHAGLGVWF